MNILHRIRRCSGTLARVNTALFVLVWLSIVVAPCAMAMQAGVSAPDHDCPHCPPRPCHEVAPEDCDAPDSLDSPRLAEKTNALELLHLRPVAHVIEPSAQPVIAFPRALPPVRAGPRAHLVHVQFNE
ncbi:MAG: hypothetical protein KGY48_10955 [Wenzhouxiangellaceae bacterium]|jgi:hypothetical protein|nr:hypothetical protein [Wenzhouxiangellaceae bacterium]MBS3747870.1 hypothetical protein [Wenzhouxiangellaceae bacterium]MBS3824280.1 hypothetical protein [Wenzhouxiangellaceae bacterium]